MKYRSLIVAATAILSLGAAAPAPSDGPLPYGEYIWSNLCKLSWGRVVGHRIQLDHRANADYLYVWVSRLENLDKTEPIGPVQFDQKTGRLHFFYQDKIDDYEADGLTTPDKFDGHYEDTAEQPEIMPRVADITEPKLCDPDNLPPMQ